MTGIEHEQRTQAYGREIFARLDRHGPLPLTPGWFDDKLMSLTMREEALKVQLFRFIDALPLLKGPEAIASHLREYLEAAGQQLPWWARLGTKMLPRRGFWGRALAGAAQANAVHLARRFISGGNVDEALQAIRRLRERSLGFTIDLLGEATITEAEADGVQAQYLELLDGLSAEVNRWPEVAQIDLDDQGPLPRVNVSVKLSALFSQFDPIDPAGTSAAVRRRLRPILRSAIERGAFVNFDMEQYAFKDVTLQIFREILTEPEFRSWADAGIAIQAYLLDTENDLRSLLDWAKQRGAPVWVRLVKGAYWDYETIVAAREGWPVPVFIQKWQSDANFETCARLLMANHDWLRPAFGSHNVRSISAVLALGDELKVPPARSEFQMLYGMADEIKDALVGLGRRVRIYTPYGKLLPGMAYLVRRLLENTSNDSFLRASFRDNVAEDKLLMKPSLPPELPHAKASPLSAPAFTNEPLADFAQEEKRARLTSALDETAKQFGRNYPLVINGEEIATTAWIESANPSHSNLIVGRCGRASVAQAEAAIQAATRAFPAWRDTEPARRAELLVKTAAQLRQRRFEFAAWAVHECGKPWREADADVAEAIDFCEYYAREMLRLAEPRRRDAPGEDNEYFYEPRGPAVVIAPWNFPLAILCGMTAAALVTGNTVIMKPAEQSSVIAAKFMESLRAAGFPPGVVNYLPGVGEEIGPTLVNHPDVALIAFTGSLNVGLLINQEASRTWPEQHFVKRVIAEMGGKNAVIVDSDADLDEAVRGVVDSAFSYQGQKCSAGSRAIVLEPIYDQFLARLIEAAKSLTVAPAESPGCSVGPVIDATALERIKRMIEQGKREAKLVYAADVGALSEEGLYVGPHIFADVPESASIAQEEIFGPVLAVLRTPNLDEALRLANGTKYALTGGLFSRSPEHIAQVKRRFRVGNLYINRKITGALVDRQPFGGFKLSGIGSKAGGPDYLLQFVLPRTITENTMRRGFAPAAQG
jgi:RHH-type transcriptional regulator, proline utilization regulon repressor / proline dehydrogenase / delta 1-pyrroline-5-carboxylate dehydrogenase